MSLQAGRLAIDQVSERHQADASALQVLLRTSGMVISVDKSLTSLLKRDPGPFGL